MQRYGALVHCGLFLSYQRIFIITFHSIPHFLHYHFQLLFLHRFLKPKVKTLHLMCNFIFLALILPLQHLPTVQNLQTFSWFPCFCLFLFISQFFIALQLSLSKYFSVQSQSYIIEFLAHVETGRGRCPKLKGPKFPFVTKHRRPAKPTKCQTAHSNKCQITLFALRVLLSPMFAKYVQDVLSSLQFHLPQRHQFILSISARYKFLILEGNQISLPFGQIDIRLQMSTNLLHSKDFLCSLSSNLLKNICTLLIFYYKCKKNAPVFSIK